MMIFSTIVTLVLAIGPAAAVAVASGSKKSLEQRAAEFSFVDWTEGIIEGRADNPSVDQVMELLAVRQGTGLRFLLLSSCRVWQNAGVANVS